MERPTKNSEKPSVMLQPEVVGDDAMVETIASSEEQSQPAVESAMPEPEAKSEEVWSKFPPQVDGTRKSKPSKGLMWLVILLVAVAVVILGLVVRTFMTKGDGVRTVVSDETPTPTVEAVTPTPSPTPEITEKTDVKIQVLNGSGVAGQAGTVATALEDLGFEDVVAANGEDNTGNTEVTYSSKVDMALVEEVLAELKGTFDQVDSAVDDTLEDYHIVITTGSGSEE